MFFINPNFFSSLTASLVAFSSLEEQIDGNKVWKLFQ